MTVKCKHKYRVFISYCRDDEELLRCVSKQLEEIDAIPVIDHQIEGGENYTIEIKRAIAHSHLVIFLLTEASESKPWAQQEVGFALGLGLKVLTLTTGPVLDGIAHESNAKRVLPDFSNIDSFVTAKALANLVDASGKANVSLSECAPTTLGRTVKLVREAELALSEQPEGCKVLQRGGFSSFAIPDDDPNSELFKGRGPSDLELRAQLRNERSILEDHSRLQGCDLIIDPYIRVPVSLNPALSPRQLLEATMIRLRILRDYLKSAKNDVRVVIDQGNIVGNLLIVGDWFMAEAIVPRYPGGFRQTTFTRHAPTILERTKEFNRDFETHYKKRSEPDVPSRLVAAAEIERLLEQYDSELDKL